MKLLLSSIRMPSHDERIILFGDNAHPSVVIVPTAWDPYQKQRRDTELTDTIDAFEKLGYQTSTLDIATSSHTQKQHAVVSNDFIWVMGGNSFYLNYYIQEDGFNDMLVNAISKGLTYGGASAGAVVMCPTLRGIEYADDPQDAPAIIWDGLGIIDFGIVPHWGMEKYADKLEKVLAEMEHYVPKVIRLTNRQAILVIDGKTETR